MDDLAPVQYAVLLIERRSVGIEIHHELLGAAARVDLHQLVGFLETLLHCEDGILRLYVDEIGILAVVLCLPYGGGGGERTAGVVIFLENVGQRIPVGVEIRSHKCSGRTGITSVEQGLQGCGYNIVGPFAAEEEIVVLVSEVGLQDISQAIRARSHISVGTEFPPVIVAQVLLHESGAVDLEEFGVATGACVGQVGHGYIFIAHPVEIVEESGAEHADVVAEHIVGTVEEAAVQEGFVTQMAALGNGCGIFPRLRHIVGHIGRSIDVQPQGSVAALAVVAGKREGMKYHSRTGGIDLLRQDDSVFADGLHICRVDPREGIHPVGIYDVIMLGTDAFPLGERVAAGRIV